MNQPLVVCQQQPNGDGKTLKSAFPKNGKRGENFLQDHCSGLITLLLLLLVGFVLAAAPCLLQ
jgi:hypothetical protein